MEVKKNKETDSAQVRFIACSREQFDELLNLDREENESLWEDEIYND